MNLSTTPAESTIERPLTPKARALLHEWVASESLRKHCEAVSACLRHVARRDSQDEDLWGAVGLLHDMDFEKHPNLELAPDGHPFVGVAYLRDNGWGETVCRAILSHADYSGVEPESALEKTLCAVDELSGFVIAVALVRPDKSIHNVEVKSVRKKLKDKAFAAKVSRDEIAHGAERLGVPMDELIAEVIAALCVEALRLGVDGAPSPIAQGGERTMPDATTLTDFTAATLVLLLVSGPAVLYIIARGIDQSRLAGLASAVGIAT